MTTDEAITAVVAMFGVDDEVTILLQLDPNPEEGGFRWLASADNDSVGREPPPPEEEFDATGMGDTPRLALLALIASLSKVMARRRGHVIPDPGVAMEDAIETASDGGEL